MRTAVVTGSGGLIGSECVSRFVERGLRVIGIDNDMRARFFGPDASTARVTERLADDFDEFVPLTLDIRDADAVDRLFRDNGAEIELVVHTAAQPSHDWAAREPHTDFAVNATGSLNLLEATRRHAPDASFVFTSTNKVYGDRPNFLPLEELDTRLELASDHEFHAGITTSMSIDRCTHSLFGVSKASADLLVQEYGRYFDMPTVCFRAGCLTGPQHAGAELHGFLAYLMKCTVAGLPYTVYGHGAKQVRDNLHASDVVSAFWAFHEAPRKAAVYNLGGGRFANVSMLEAIALCEKIAGQPLDWQLSDRARVGDHRWYISDLGEFQADYPEWSPNFGIEETLGQIHAANAEHWSAERTASS